MKSWNRPWTRWQKESKTILNSPASTMVGQNLFRKESQYFGTRKGYSASSPSTNSVFNVQMWVPEGGDRLGRQVSDPGSELPMNTDPWSPEVRCHVMWEQKQGSARTSQGSAMYLCLPCFLPIFDDVIGQWQWLYDCKGVLQDFKQTFKN